MADTVDIQKLIDMVDNPPKDFKERFERISQLKREVNEASEKLDKRVEAFFAGSVKPPEEYQAIQKEFAKNLAKADEIVLMSNRFKKVLERYLNSVYDHLQRLEEVDKEKLWCYCQKPWDVKVDPTKSVGCEGRTECLGHEWYHLKCVNLDKIPKGKWWCSECLKKGVPDGLRKKKGDKEKASPKPSTSRGRKRKEM